jgi:hypothetical protein
VSQSRETPETKDPNMDFQLRLACEVLRDEAMFCRASNVRVFPREQWPECREFYE